MSMHPAAEAYTAQDYLQWEGDWELIHGQSVARVPSPSFDHQRASAAVFRQLDESLDECPRCHVLFAMDVDFAQDTVVRPDVLVICYQPASERLTRAPDLIVEVISPKTTRRDGVVKFDLYRTEGVSHYVLVYPEAKRPKCGGSSRGNIARRATSTTKPTASNCRNAPSISISAACGSARAAKCERRAGCT